jgi:hypothetical protein
LRPVSRAVAIFGSCVTRDAFELQSRQSADADTVALYLSRTTINASLAAPVAALGASPPAGQSPASQMKFEERCAIADLEKTHFQDLRRKRFDVLVIDLIDERHWLVDIDGGEATYSVPFVKLCETRGIDHARFPRTSPTDVRLVERTLANIPRFLARLAQVIDPSRIVLHEAGWARRYVATHGTIREFADRRMIDGVNAILDRYFAAMKAACPGMRSIRVPEDQVLGDESHRWTLEPFHYAQSYYREFLRQYDAIMAAQEFLPRATRAVGA